VGERKEGGEVVALSDGLSSCSELLGYSRFCESAKLFEGERRFVLSFTFTTHFDLLW